MNLSVSFLLLTLSFVHAVYLRESAQRIRHFDNHDPSTFQLAATNPQADALFAQLAKDPNTSVDTEGKKIEEKTISEEEAFQELLDTLSKVGGRSMPLTESPTVSTVPTSAPVVAPTHAPNSNGSPSSTPTSEKPTETPTASPSTGLVGLDLPTSSPTTSAPTTSQPTVSPSLAPTFGPTTAFPTSQPTIAVCGISETERSQRLLATLSQAVANPDVLSDMSTAQGLATDWILNQDAAVICPDNDKFLQRWVLAVIYYSTGGDEWIQCSANPAAVDACGTVVPHLGATRFLSSGTECDWAGISCIQGCVTEIEFEENNLVGVIPTEIGLLSDLAVWGMERGGLTSTIPTEIGRLSNLIFLDLDFNQLTGSLPDELYTLTDLTQLDVNDNQLTGSINNMGVFLAMEFLQLHANDFTGTVSSGIGNFTNLAAFTLHETLISGEIPPEVCSLFTPPGILTTLIADCGGPSPNIECSCCTDCRS